MTSPADSATFDPSTLNPDAATDVTATLLDAMHKASDDEAQRLAAELVEFLALREPVDGHWYCALLRGERRRRLGRAEVQ